MRNVHAVALGLPDDRRSRPIGGRVRAERLSPEPPGDRQASGEVAFGSVAGLDDSVFRYRYDSVFRYRYDRVAPTVTAEGCELASLTHVGAMKLAAICQRFTKRDHGTREIPARADVVKEARRGPFEG